MTYDPNNVFAKVIRGELPSKKVYEDEYVLAFHDIKPQAPTHIIVCPKGPYISLSDFSENGKDQEIVYLIRAVGIITKNLGLDKTGYRTITNTGPDAHPEIPHLHIQILGGRPLGPILANVA